MATTPHFVLLPNLAPGHMNPMVDIAKLIAKRNVVVSILLTPQNANRMKKVVDRAIASGLKIHIYLLTFPSTEAGLPQGCENVDSLTSLRYFMKFMAAIEMLEEQVERLLLELQPTCFIADMLLSWPKNLALKLRIPHLMFHGSSCFALVGMNLLNSKILEGVASDNEYFIIPDLPHRIEITKAQLRGMPNQMSPELARLNQQILDSEKGALGTISNTFQELENEYVEEYMKTRAKKVWCIGPVSLCNQDFSDQANRGKDSSIDGHDCLKWLDSHKSNSVIYACLGSVSRLPDAQHKELGLGLEASNHPFIWVIRNVSDELQSWLLEEKFEERIGGRGLVIKGWAPQVLILSHPSLGGFLTHCGWNSTLEGVSAGVPMITCPLFGDQFLNEKFIVKVIKIGVSVGVEVPIWWDPEVGSDAVLVKNDDVKRAIDELMDGGEEGRERRERARKLGEMAKRAVEEGGSSHCNMTELIQEMVKLKAKYEEESVNGTTFDEVAKI